MALKIIRASDPIPVNQITMCLYGQPGLGKTSIGFTAEAPLLLDFDQGSYRSAFRKDVVQVTSWQEVALLEADDLKAYKTVIVDTVGRLLDVLGAEIIASDAKARTTRGTLSLQGYGVLKNDFIVWLRKLHLLDKDVVLMAHMDESRKGEEVLERLDVTGGSKNEIYKVADAIGRLTIVGNRRTLNFNPGEAAFGKNPAGLEILSVPDFGQDPQFLRTLITRIKTTLNVQSEQSTQAQIECDELRAALSKVETPEALNAVVHAYADSKNKTLKSLIHKRAKVLSLEYREEIKGYAGKAETA